nr:MAG TPA: hypothetical protein [Caudoviricetes sp.]
MDHRTLLHTYCLCKNQIYIFDLDNPVASIEK